MKRRNDDEPQEGDDYKFIPTNLGSITVLEEHTRRTKIKRRPIGFLANIDEFIED